MSRSSITRAMLLSQKQDKANIDHTQRLTKINVEGELNYESQKVIHTQRAMKKQGTLRNLLKTREVSERNKFEEQENRR